MNHEDLFEAIGAADEKLLEKSERKPRQRKKVIFAAIAACLVLALTVGVLLPRESVSPQHLVAPDRITWSVDSNVLIDEDDGIMGLIPVEGSSGYQFAWAMSIEAKVIEVLPDTYSDPGTSTGSQRYRILHLKVLDEIVGTNMPEDIYYRLPETLDPDLTEYDSLILNLEQVGVENYLMINETRRQSETFSILFGQATYAPEWGAVLAYKDDKLDLSLWDKEGWNDFKDWGVQLTSDIEPVYPAKVDRNIENTKRAILELAEEYKRDGEYTFYTEVLTSDFFNWKEAREVIEYVEPFENGTFQQYLDIESYKYRKIDPDNSVSIRYTRNINGFKTNEVINIARSFNGRNKEISRSGEQFNEQDMANLPDLVSVIENIDQYLPEKYWGADAMEHFCGVRGEYHKVNGTVYGVVIIEWGDTDYEEPKGPTCLIGMRVYEQTYVMVFPDGTSRVVTEEELESYIG